MELMSLLKKDAVEHYYLKKKKSRIPSETVCPICAQAIGSDWFWFLSVSLWTNQIDPWAELIFFVCPGYKYHILFSSRSSYSEVGAYAGEARFPAKYKHTR